MQVTEQTKWCDFEPYAEVLTQESIQDLKHAAEKKYGFCNNLTIDEFFGLQAGDLSLLGDVQDPTVLQVFWIKRFKDFCSDFIKVCERLTIKDPANAYVYNGCVDMEPLESMLIFTREYFGLPSFSEAGKRTIGEYLTARKDKYNEARKQRNFEEKQKQRFKTKR